MGCGAAEGISAGSTEACHSHTACIIAYAVLDMSSGQSIMRCGEPINPYAQLGTHG